jgi:AI-2 transport system substrate-binding protein
MRKILVVLLALTMVFSMFGCGGGAQEPSDDSGAAVDPADISVAFIPKLTGNSFFESANLGAQDIAAEVGFECVYTGNPEASVANQVQVINSAVQQGFNAIAISSVTPDGLNNALKAAKEAGLQIVCWDSDVQNDMRSLHVAQVLLNSSAKCWLKWLQCSCRKTRKIAATMYGTIPPQQ